MKWKGKKKREIIFNIYKGKNSLTKLSRKSWQCIFEVFLTNSSKKWEKNNFLLYTSFDEKETKTPTRSHHLDLSESIDKHPQENDKSLQLENLLKHN